MIDKKILLGISITAIFAISMIASQSMATAAAGDAIQVKDYEITIDADTNEMSVKITSNQDIPLEAESGAIGFGVLTDGTNNVLALTTHLCASDSPVQGPAGALCDETAHIDVGQGTFTEHNDATWHAHFLDLKPADGFCKDAGAKVWDHLMCQTQ
jgi:hypothetical protein